jgi:hypothetical protein
MCGFAVKASLRESFSAGELLATVAELIQENERGLIPAT